MQSVATVATWLLVCLNENISQVPCFLIVFSQPVPCKENNTAAPLFGSMPHSATPAAIVDSVDYTESTINTTPVICLNRGY